MMDTFTSDVGSAPLLGSVHAIQLELSQRTYMDKGSLEYDDTKASRLRDTLEQMLRALMRAAHK